MQNNFTIRRMAKLMYEEYDYLGDVKIISIIN